MGGAASALVESLAPCLLLKSPSPDIMVFFDKNHLEEDLEDVTSEEVEGRL